MNEERAIVGGFVAIVVATALLSGPLLGQVDLTGTASSESYGFAEGSATVGDVEFPDTAVLRSGRYGAEIFYLEIEPARADLQRVVGQPALTYSLSIPDMGVKREALHLVTADDQGTVELTMGDMDVDATDVTADAYTGEVSVNVRHSTASYEVANESIRIDVVR